MRRAALPCWRRRLVVLGVTAAAVAAVVPSAEANRAAAPTNRTQVWGLALPAGVKTVKPGQFRWLAQRGATSIVVSGIPRASARKLARAASRANLTVIAPGKRVPSRACKASTGTLRTCAAYAPTPVAAVKLARRGLVDYVVIRVRSPRQLRMLRGSTATRSRIVAVLPLSTNAAARAAWRSGIAYAAADPVLELAVGAAPAASKPLATYLAAIPRARIAATAGPAAPTSLLVVATSTTTVSLRWTASPEPVVGYGVYQDGSFVVNVGTRALTLTGLQCGRSYTFGVDAHGDSGARSGRVDVVATTNACGAPTAGGGGGSGGAGTSDVLPPTAPLGLAVIAATQTSVMVSWTASIDNVAVAGYGLYRNGTAVGSSLVTSASFSGLACGSTYSVSVDSYDDAGNRSAVTTASAATSPCGGGADTTAPTTPGTLTKTGSTTSSISVSWAASSDNVAVTGYGLYRNGSWAGSTTSTSATISGLACGSSYTLAVDAYDAAANRSPQRTLTTTTSACPPPADTTPPTSPSNLSTSGVGQTAATVSWTASSDNVGVVGYRTFRNGATVATVSGTSSTFTGLTCGTSYTLAVEAYDAAGNISSRPSVGATTAACTPAADTQAPSVPQGMAFGAIAETTVALVWNASTDNVGVAGYRLYRNDVAVGTVTSPGYTYSGLTCGTSYTFALEAYDAAGNASNRAFATGTTSTSACSAPPPPPPPPPSPPGSGVANVWVDADGGSCVRKATPAGYVNGDACRTFDQAWDAIAAGETARVVAGSYGQQVLTGNKSAPTFLIGEGGVTLSGATPVSCGYSDGLVCANANFLHLSNVTLDAGSAHGQSTGSEVIGTNVTFSNVNLHGSFVSLYVRGQNFTWQGGRLGQDGVNGGQRSCNTGDGEPVWIESSAAGATLDGIRFNSMSASGAACSGSVDGFHLEYVRVQATPNVTIRNSTFVPDAGSGNGAGSGKIFVTSSSASSSAANGLTLIGNSFGTVKGSYSIQTHANVQNANGWQIRNNTFAQPVMSPNLPAGAACGNTGPVATAWKTAC